MHPRNLFEPKQLINRTIFRFNPEARDCYTNDEIEFYLLDNRRYRYSYDNCLIEGFMAGLARNCRCTRGFGTELLSAIIANLSREEGGKRKDDRDYW